MSKTPRRSPELLIFLHIPKASGSTLNGILEREYRGRRIWNATYPGDDELERLSPDERATIELVKGHLHFGLHRLFQQKTTYVTLAREPVERVLSHYYYVLRTPEHHLHRQIVDTGLKLHDYVVGDLSGEEVENGQVRLLSQRAREMATCDRACLDEAKQNLVDFFPVVGLTERFDESVLLFRQCFGWRLPLYASVNVGIRPKRAPIPEETRQAIRERNQLDEELYEFAAERFDTAVTAAGVKFERSLRRFRRVNGPASAIARRTRHLRQALRTH